VTTPAPAFTIVLADVKAALNIPPVNTSHDVELQRFIDAAVAHVMKVAGSVTFGERTETVTATSSGVLLLPVWPVESVASITQGGTTLSGDQLSVTRAGVVRRTGGRLSGDWSVTYTAGVGTADLYLAALEDIRGLYQVGQLGPPSEGVLGAAGADEGDGPSFRPVRMWPRIDAWAASRSVGVA
jgi:hypothetical protein